MGAQDTARPSAPYDGMIVSQADIVSGQHWLSAYVGRALVNENVEL
jgi:hypothetical protein